MEDVKQREDKTGGGVTKINNTKIKYLQVEDKLYEVTKISFFYMTIEASETDLAVDDVCEDEVWGIGEFKNYKVKLINCKGKAEIINMKEWMENHGL